MARAVLLDEGQGTLLSFARVVSDTVLNGCVLGPSPREQNQSEGNLQEPHH